MIDRSTLNAYDAYMLDTAVTRAQQRRARNRAQGVCINENSRGTHGKATHGVRCYRCCRVHMLGAKALE